MADKVQIFFDIVENIVNKMCLWDTNAPETPIFWETWPLYLTLTFADDLDLGTRRFVQMRYAFIPNRWLCATLS